MTTKNITIYHSPDADDAFMFYGIVTNAVSEPGYQFRSELCDIETLNHRAKKKELEVTAVSVHAYAYLSDTYAILRCGASMGGKDYGPRIVAKNILNLADGKVRTLGVPGSLTSATLALELYLREQKIKAELVTIPFMDIEDEVKKGTIDAGVLIHEGQLTHVREGLTTLVDLGEWWYKNHKLPLPLGVNVVRKDLGDDAMRATYRILRGSIEYGMENRKAALDHALQYGRGLQYEEADTFVGMYVNNYTIDLGDEGVRSIELFLKMGVEQGFIPEHAPPQFVQG